MPADRPDQKQRFTTLATHRSNRLVWYKRDTVFVPAAEALNSQLKWVRVSHGQLSTPACPGNRHTSPGFLFLQLQQILYRLERDGSHELTA